jgi:hypothetical protein
VPYRSRRANKSLQRIGPESCIAYKSLIDAVGVSRNLVCEYLCDNTRSGGATSSNMALQLIPCLVADNSLLETEFTRVQINDRLTRLEIEFTELFPLILQALRMTLD